VPEMEKLVIQSEKFSQILREATYKYELDLLDRSWFISPTNEIWGDASHRFMLKNRYKFEWNTLKLRGESDGDIEDVLTNRLINEGYIKIGELTDFYSMFYKLTQSVENKLQGFCKSLLEKDISLQNRIIHLLPKNGQEIASTIGEIAEDYLYSLRERKV
jgi:hypothetical protein